MSTLKVDTILKRTGTGTISIGQSGDTISIPSGATLNSAGTNTLEGIANTPSFSVKLGSNQTISNASDTKITLDTENWDTDSAFASNKFTVPSAKAGKYLFVFSARTDLAINTQAYCYVFKNGSQILESTTGTVKPNATCTAHMTGSVIADLAVSDYIELYIYQNSGSSQLAYANYCALMGQRLIGA
jgi:hypothetical protein